jgi:hypothetical protein
LENFGDVMSLPSASDDVGSGGAIFELGRRMPAKIDVISNA